MSPELEDVLLNKYPELFVSVNEATKFWGFEVGDGWFNLVDNLCKNIIEESVINDIENVYVDQVKEKFGTLRFYYTGGDDYVRGLVSMAEDMSAHICEECGNKGKLVSINGWMVTACNEHTRTS